MKNGASARSCSSRPGPRPVCPKTRCARISRRGSIAGACPTSSNLWRICRSERRARSTKSSRSEEHTSELQSLMRISYAVFCLKKKTHYIQHQPETHQQALHTPHFIKKHPPQLSHH